MIGLFTAIIILNFIVIKIDKVLTGNQILHIWCFTVAFQTFFDIFVEFKYGGYWYFDKEIDFLGLLSHLLIVPPVNILFLNYYPLKKPFFKRLIYIGIWVAIILVYELIALLPEPWGYFHYGWWTIVHSILLDPVLFAILIIFFRWILFLEKRALEKMM
ncbi:hypothetical protein [Bacillus seohaeanensis]|jgi:hypothetical protein|uniref:DUF1405 domain-containing protein n=1 Tax=Bacillus seohaeanensis TaxID=284580 RepID=A0ABW5RNY2_9BACI